MSLCAGSSPTPIKGAPKTAGRFGRRSTTASLMRGPCRFACRSYGLSSLRAPFPPHASAHPSIILRRFFAVVVPVRLVVASACLPALWHLRHLVFVPSLSDSTLLLCFFPVPTRSFLLFLFFSKRRAEPVLGQLCSLPLVLFFSTFLFFCHSAPFVPFCLLGSSTPLVFCSFGAFFAPRFCAGIPAPPRRFLSRPRAFRTLPPKASTPQLSFPRPSGHRSPRPPTRGACWHARAALARASCDLSRSPPRAFDVLPCPHVTRRLPAPGLVRPREDARASRALSFSGALQRCHVACSLRPLPCRVGVLRSVSPPHPIPSPRAPLACARFATAHPRFTTLTPAPRRSSCGFPARTALSRDFFFSSRNCASPPSDPISLSCCAMHRIARNFTKAPGASRSVAAGRGLSSASPRTAISPSRARTGASPPDHPTLRTAASGSLGSRSAFTVGGGPGFSLFQLFGNMFGGIRQLVSSLRGSATSATPPRAAELSPCTTCDPELLKTCTGAEAGSVKPFRYHVLVRLPPGECDDPTPGAWWPRGVERCVELGRSSRGDGKWHRGAGIARKVAWQKGSRSVERWGRRPSTRPGRR